MQMVGFFHLLPSLARQAEVLRSLQGEDGPDYPQSVLHYLRSARVAFWTPELVTDPLAIDRFAGEPSIHTDGVWLWPSTLAHYVSSYRIRLPEDFIQDMRAAAWDPGDYRVTPSEEDQIIEALELGWANDHYAE